MGGLYFLFHNMQKTPINIEFTKNFMKMKPRGEDDTQIITDNTPLLSGGYNMSISGNPVSILSKRELAEYKQIIYTYGYHRLSINDTSIDGSQPFEDPILHKIHEYPMLRNRTKRKLLCNGEIYNYNKLKEEHNFSDRDLQSESDVEIIMPLYIKCAEEAQDSENGLINCINQLNGDFSFILTENTKTINLKNINIFAVRDVFGSKPLYMVKYNMRSDDREFFYLFVSEIKAIPIHILNDNKYIIKEVPPGCFWSYNNSIIKKNKEEFIKYNDYDIYKNLELCSIKTADPNTISKIYKNIKNITTTNIIDRFNNSHRNVGVLLSGGFDSCIILSILVKYLTSTGNYDTLNVFTIGDQDNSDVILAKKHVLSLEEYYNIDIEHHIVNVTDINLITSEIDNIIYYLETYDTTTIQQSIPMNFLFKYIKEKTNVKVLLTGEGLDELCGYSQFNNLNDIEFQNKSVNLINNIGKYDLLRSDKISSAYGLELRYPFLDKKFVEYVFSIHPMLKRPQVSGYSDIPIEKYIIRKAFDTGDDSFFIDKDILWNPRQNISDSINNLYSQLKEFYNNIYSDIEFFNYKHDIDLQNRNMTKEDMYYKKTFEKMYPNSLCILEKYWESL